MIKFSTLFSGSSGNCLFVSDGETRLLVDAGKPARTVERELCKIGEAARELQGILLTHEHTDHIRGLRVLAKKWGLPVFLNRATAEAASLEGDDFPLFLFEAGRGFAVGEIEILPFSLSHDAADTAGFSLRFPREGKHLVIAADTGRVTEDLETALPGSDLVYIESNYDENMLFSGRYPYFLKRRIAGEAGHLSNADCAALCARAVAKGAKHLVLGHLSQENNMPEIAFLTCRHALHEQGMKVGQDCTLDVSPREAAGRVIIF